MRTTLTQHIVNILSTSSFKNGLVNNQIAAVLFFDGVDSSCATIDNALSIAAKKDIIQRRPSLGKFGNSKYVYYIRPAPSIVDVIRASIKKSKIDSREVFLTVRSVLPTVSKSSIDSTLAHLVNKKEIIRSKNPMTDGNTTSSQSKFVYSR